MFSGRLFHSLIVFEHIQDASLLWLRVVLDKHLRPVIIVIEVCLICYIAIKTHLGHICRHASIMPA